ncbi:MAG TPA: ABC transporter permease [Solirubrobacteraceae bacterium]|nr:ABC transporter permease [Solirubrobacteraceae bacterium]
MSGPGRRRLSSSLRGTRGREAVRLIARREIVVRARERSFLIGTGVSLAIIVLVTLLPNLLGFGGRDSYTITALTPAAQPVADAAVAVGEALDADVTVESGSAVGDVDAALTADAIRAQDEPDGKLVEILQAANARVRSGEALEEAGVGERAAREALSPPPLRVRTDEPEEGEGRSGFAFFAVLLLYGQLIGIGYFVAAGVVEEKSSRVVEVLLATVKPIHLLAGKVIGLGILGLGQLLVLAVAGLAVAGLGGALEVDGQVLGAAALALVWFVVGYAFYGAAFACAASLVSRQEDLQSVLTPLSLMLMVGFFASFAVAADPDGTFAVVASFIPPLAPMIMPLRIAVGEATAAQIGGAFVVTLGSAAILIPLAARIYSGAILRTGAAVKLREAWRSA